MVSFPLIFREDDAEPLYRQLYNCLKTGIANDSIRAGEKLPSKRQLAANARISQNTVETAYGQLLAEGYICSVPKSGYFVCNLEGSVPIHRRTPVPSGSQVELKSSFRYDFKTNTVDTSQFPFATWARISRDIMREENRGILSASHPQGDYALRKNIAGYLHDFRGVNCTPEQIIVGAGTEYLLGTIVQLLGQRTVYGAENPGYMKTFQVLKSFNADVALVGLDNEGLSIRQLENAAANVAYVTPSHHFPLGIVMPVNRRLQLLKWANGRQDRYIIEDDYDSEFRFNGRPIPSLQGMDEDRVIYISTFSKSLAPSIRMSYMVLPEKLLDDYRQNLSFYSSTVSRFEQFILCRFIEGGHFERHINRMRNLYKARKDTLVEQIEVNFGDRVEIIGENAGMHLLLKFSGSLTEEELIARAARAGIKVYGLSEYYIVPLGDMPKNTVVLGYADFCMSQIVDAIAMLKNAWS